MTGIYRAIIALIGIVQCSVALAQDASLSFATVERPPFAFQGETGPEGFSIDLMNAIAVELDQTVTFSFADSFGGMLDTVVAAEVDGAIANISMTAAREEVLDFSQPVFESGIGVLLPEQGGSNSVLSALLKPDFLVVVLAALALLFGGGILMWVFERRKQPYFDKSARDAMFPAFWWALNLVVNGGFEERVPQSLMGRLLAVLMVISSLFIVSIFVANITATMTVGALQDGIDSVNDLEGRTVGTINGSTSATFLEARDLPYEGFDSLDTLLEAFEAKVLDAVVFDSPILAYYVEQGGTREARLMNRNYRPENYGIALPSGSGLKEPIDQAILRLRENGTYATLLRKWFGQSSD